MNRILGLILLPLLISIHARADEVLTLYVFTSQDCAHCEAQRPFLQSLAEHHLEVTMRTFEVLRTARHHDRFRTMALAHGVDGGLSDLRSSPPSYSVSRCPPKLPGQLFMWCRSQG